jgi:hypothetical protein
MSARRKSMRNLVTSSFHALAFLLAGALAIPAAAYADDTPKTPQQEEIDRIKAEADRDKAEADLITQRAARDKAKIDALGLPAGYNGTTTLSGTNAGVMEANMLAMYALQAAADGIVSDVKGKAGKVVVLAGNENADLNQVVMIEAQLDGIESDLISAIGPPRRETRRSRSSRSVVESSFALPISPTTIVEAVSAVAGLLRSETTVTAVDLASVSERALANAVAGRLTNASLPSAVIGRPTGADNLLKQLDRVGTLRNQAALRLAAVDPKSVEAVALTAAIKRFDDFNIKVTTPDDKGMVPIVRAAQLSTLFGKDADKIRVLRVFVDRAGGTFVSTKNLGTFFGADPLRVTGGLVASYALTNPGTGQVLTSNIFVCRTSLSRLRQIHDANWRGPPLNQGRCTPMANGDGGGSNLGSSTAGSR